MKVSKGQFGRFYDFQSQYCVLESSHRLHYLDEGEGSIVLMLHGNPTWSFMYRNLAAKLRSSHRVIVPDHIGCGLSDKPHDSSYAYTLGQRVSDLEELLERIDAAGDLTLVVHDWGGLIGMGYAARHPSRLKRLILFNTAAFHLSENQRLHWSLRLCMRSRITHFLIRSLNVFAFAASHLGCRRRRLPREIRQAYRAPYDSWNNRIAVLRFIQDIPLKRGDRAYPVVTMIQDSLDQFAEIPTLICWGVRDFIFDARFLEEWIRRFPDARAHRFRDAGHYVLEDAYELIAPLVEQFLEENPLRAPANEPL
jgi:haloalkane dehalogenase